MWSSTSPTALKDPPIPSVQGSSYGHIGGCRLRFGVQRALAVWGLGSGSRITGRTLNLPVWLKGGLVCLVWGSTGLCFMKLEETSGIAWQPSP